MQSSDYLKTIETDKLEQKEMTISDLIKADRIQTKLILFKDYAFLLDDEISSLSTLANDDFRKDLVALRLILNSILQRLENDPSCFK